MAHNTIKTKSNKNKNKMATFKNLHFEYPVSFTDPSIERCSSFEHGTDVLQRSVKLTIDALQLASLADLAADVKPEASDALRDNNFSRARRYFRRHCPSTLHHMNG